LRIGRKRCDNAYCISQKLPNMPWLISRRWGGTVHVAIPKEETIKNMLSLLLSPLSSPQCPRLQRRLVWLA
jgi:hypothetical protein